jgi:hypothetical protein
VSWRSENLGCQKHNRQKVCTPRERQKHTAAGGIFQCLRLPSACNRDFSAVEWSTIIFIASDNHISHIYICHGHIIFNFITAQTYGHNFGPDALARKHCRARVLAMHARALGVVPYGPVPPCSSDHALSERYQVRPCTCTCDRWGATAPALEARRRYKQVRWKRL